MFYLQPPLPSVPKKYSFPVKRILLTTDPKEKHGKGYCYIV